MKHLITSLVLLVFITSYTGCIQDDDPKAPIDQLPPLTTTGENTFGYLVNGEALVVRNTLQLTAIFQQGQLQFGGGGVYMILGDPLLTNASYDLKSQAEYLVDSNPQLGCHYNFEKTYEGSITFSKIDRVNFIISGIFNFSTVTSGCDTVRITDGRFDMQYIP